MALLGLVCLPWAASELALLEHLRVVVCLGAFAWDAALRLCALAGSPPPRPRPRFGHGSEWASERWTLLGSYHPSQQNTFTGKLTPAMIVTVLTRASALADQQEPSERCAEQAVAVNGSPLGFELRTIHYEGRRGSSPAPGLHTTEPILCVARDRQ